MGGHSFLQGIFLTGIEPGSPALQTDSLPSESPGSPGQDTGIAKCQSLDETVKKTVYIQIYNALLYSHKIKSVNWGNVDET